MSHPDKTIKTTNKRSRTIRDEKSKSSCIHALLLSPGPKKYHSTQDFIPLFPEYKSEWKTSSKKTPKRRKQRKPPKKEWHGRWTRNVRRHEMYSTWFSNDVIRFRPCCGGSQIGVALSYHGPPFHETRLKSALGLRSTNAIRYNNHLLNEKVLYPPKRRCRLTTLPPHNGLTSSLFSFATFPSWWKGSTVKTKVCFIWKGVHGRVSQV